jgi:hypothetical protein
VIVKAFRVTDPVTKGTKPSFVTGSVTRNAYTITPTDRCYRSIG